MSKLFIDADVILDMLLGREHQNEAALFFTQIEEGRYIGCTSPLVFANLHYMLSRQVGKQKSLRSLRKLRKLLSIVPIGEQVLDEALYADAKDFEDAIQYIAAENIGVNIIITRNKKDYDQSRIPVFSAKEFLAAEHNFGA
jgi:predicted nucleic acid-binding protein